MIKQLKNHKIHQIGLEFRISFVILILFFVGCRQNSKNSYSHFAGEQYSICNISYNHSLLKANIIIDSLKKINPILGKSIQDKYTYDTEGTGFDEDVVYFWKNEIHYVLSISYVTSNLNQKLAITHFGIDGEILRSFDNLSDDDLILGASLIREKLLVELEKYFPTILFNCDCGNL